ncbi:uncharacterized protein LOC124445390 [Xenia sp. Carnegie-2017]|uniref:uncharacterized protein LOC124445390 n=1 Tax=Xenia sp. Carnegie-2017 TaxID=2897299 RepID=UPI001F04EC35|nr:uncharacterized protein LOC124445390 [Xenia sp. Carnegie-2017]
MARKFGQYFQRAYFAFLSLVIVVIHNVDGDNGLSNFLSKEKQNTSALVIPPTAATSSCLSRGNNCSLCLKDGNCGFCDTCKDMCHRPEAVDSPSCANCARCIPGALDGPKKGHECRVEWFYYEKCPEIVNEQKTVYVEIALYLINVHSVDLKAGTFHADFYLYFKVPDGQTKYTKQKCKDGPKEACFELVNAAGQPEVSSHEGKYFRVKSTFNFAADLRDYPYDNQTLRIVIQDMEMAAKELRWHIMQAADGQDFKFRSGVSPMLNYTGWLFDTNSWSQMVYERYNPFLDQGVSRYEFFFHMRRHKRAAFFKIFLPPLFIVLVVCFSFSIPPKDSSMRLWIDGSLLISAVMFHATTGEQTPDSQELTLADNFMVGVYGFIFVSFIVTTTMLRLQRDNYFYFADVFYSYTEWLVWFSGPSFFFLLYYMRFSLYHVLMAELVISLVAMLLKKFCSFTKKIVFRITSFDKILEKHLSERSKSSLNTKTETNLNSSSGLPSRKTSNDYRLLPQNEDLSIDGVLKENSRTCFPGKVADTDDCCPKRKILCNRQT